MDALVSIIIPVYNLENYIENCLKSISAQTYKNIEIICVDDGSKDNSADVVRDYAKSDNRVRYVYQENAGVSAARNKGIAEAKGDYLMFVDGDDYMHYRAVEIFLNCIKNSSFSIVCAPEVSTLKMDEEMHDISSYRCEKTDHEGLFSYKYGSVLGKSVWSKIFKTDVAKSVRFNENFSNGEDANYMIRILTQGVEVGVVGCNLYYYYTREDSCVTSRFTKSKFSITLSFDDLCEHLKKTDYSFLQAYCLQYLFQTICYNRTLSIGTDAQDYVLSESKRIGNKWLKAFVKNNDIDIKIRILFTIFFKSRPIYELARIIQDPTMKDYYKNRKKNK